MEDIGWIKLHRKFTDWEWYHDRKVKEVFLHLLLKANYQEKKLERNKNRERTNCYEPKAFSGRVGFVNSRS